MRAGICVAILTLTAAMAACGGSSASSPTSSASNGNTGSTSGASGGTGITESLTLSGALQGQVTYDNDGSSLGLARGGCTKPDLSSQTPFGMLFLGHLSGQPAASLEVNVAQSPSAANVATPHISLTFPDSVNSIDISLKQGANQWDTTMSGTLTIDLSGGTETGTVNAEVQGGSPVSGSTTQLHIAGNWSCQAS